MNDDEDDGKGGSGGDDCKNSDLCMCLIFVFILLLCDSFFVGELFLSSVFVFFLF